MKASLHSARIAPKKAAVLARMVRGLTVTEAQDILAHTHKKAARLIEALLKSAVANATHNAKQRPEELVIRSIIVNQGSSYRRGVPMARGRMRPMRKFLSHIDIVLGVMEGESEGERTPKKPKKPKMPRSEKTGEKASRNVESVVQKGRPAKKNAESSSDSSASSVSSVSS